MDTQTPAGPDAGTPGTTPGTGPGPHPGTTPPPAPNGFWAGVRRTGLYRSDERWVGGVAGGLAARIGVDPLIVRGVLAVSFLLGGLGLLLYGVAWALLPDARDNRILLERLGAGDADGALLGSLAFVVVGLARGDGWWWFWDGSGAVGGTLWLLFVVGVVALVVSSQKRNAAARQAAPAWGTPTAAASAPAAGGPTATLPLPTSSVGVADAPAPYGPPAPPSYGPPAPPAPPFGGAPVLPAPPAPPRPPRRSADAATVGAVVGLSIVGLGALLLADRVGAYDGPLWITAGGIALVVAGLGIVTLGLRGRSSGFVGFLAVAGLLVWVPTALVHQTEWSDGLRGWESEGRAQDVTATSRTVAAAGWDLGAGTSRIDLTGVPLDDEVLRVPIAIGAGQLTVVVPREAAVQADVTAGLGSVRVELDDDVHEQSGVGLGDLTYLDDDAEAGSPNLVLEISSGVGEVRIIEEDAA
ncbi:phage shock protein C, PspC [Cellulomonas flavigena DSM 20109]|uniref:Phage shock protein C, PspC n=1 Tax=Cellulomonas flavigena (strain ATCC 482 / DSM 20109 / BCRC 11376 / JCM 18109 / NBRC 3775 / NCIMB 8073 / NRS 134) TaxID=446466 RepID=D5UI88_CELFN|nr:PspC domain-containing protein [Cellulomonas flavigena]ADG75433.1 phage shock protein C, PspC [Cellulomonas flavigena DSM 20109]